MKSELIFIFKEAENNKQQLSELVLLNICYISSLNYIDEAKIFLSPKFLFP